MTIAPLLSDINFASTTQTLDSCGLTIVSFTIWKMQYLLLLLLVPHDYFPDKHHLYDFFLDPPLKLTDAEPH